jgi:2-keto-3-deoxy-L-rhamnonate aldolase RhmA
MRYRQENASPQPSVLNRLSAGEPVLSLGVRSARTSDIARMACGAGYQVIWIDLEHSSMPIDCAAQIAATATDLGMAAWVRVPEREYGVIGRLLDCGATGIISPKVETADEARLVAAACRFPPDGQRSSIALLPQFGFVRAPAVELTRQSNENVVVQILLETAKGIANADEIAAVEGVDLLAMGMNDLSADLGCPGDLRDPRIAAACSAVAAAAARHGKIAVVGGVADAAHFLELTQAGFAPLIFAGIDTDILANGLVQRGLEWRGRFSE